MVASFSDGKYIYSVDLMHTYINNKKLEVKKVKIDLLLKNLKYDGWGDPTKNIKYSPLDVLANPKKYKKDYVRIIKADLKYPIIVDSNYNIIDGVHRLTQVYMNKKQTIKAYQFDDNLLKKFKIAKNGEWKKADNITIADLVTLYIKKLI
jgi:disulfide oxidoreductase YuzD